MKRQSTGFRRLLFRQSSGISLSDSLLNMLADLGNFFCLLILPLVSIFLAFFCDVSGIVIEALFNLILLGCFFQAVKIKHRPDTFDLQHHLLILFPYQAILLIGVKLFGLLSALLVWLIQIVVLFKLGLHIRVLTIVYFLHLPQMP